MQDRARQQIVPAWQAMLGDAWKLTGPLVNPRHPDRADHLHRHAEAVVSDIVDLAKAASYTGDRLARRLPGYSLVTGRLRQVERAVLKEFKQRLDDAAVSDLGGRGPVGRGATRRGDARVRMLEELLQASLRADTNRSRENLHLRMLRGLVPDEARILAALADGTRYPLIHIETRGPGSTRTVLANACTVGRVAGVHLNSAVPVYVTHLRDLGLVEEGPQDDDLSDQYLLLESEDYARRADSDAQDGRLGTKTVKRTLRISALGEELWAACRPDEPVVAADPIVEDTYRSAYAGSAPDRAGDK